MHASQLTHPRLQVLYGLDGRVNHAEHELPLPGYRHSQPVRVGNAASAQVQLDIYGELLQTAWLYARDGRRLDRDTTANRVAAIADLVCVIWREPDSGISEVRSEPRHFTHSKMMCCTALDRAALLADTGQLPAPPTSHMEPSSEPSLPPSRKSTQLRDRRLPVRTRDARTRTDHERQRRPTAAILGRREAVA